MTLQSPIVEAWVDGSGDTRPPRVGGWAAVIRLADSPFTQEICGAEINTTSQRMEMTALLRVLEHFPEPCPFVIYSDSAYVVNCFEQQWIAGWRRRGWISSKGTPVANRDLWELLDRAVGRHDIVRFVKIRGHAGHEHNERADCLAGQARRSLLSSL